MPAAAEPVQINTPAQQPLASDGPTQASNNGLDRNAPLDGTNQPNQGEPGLATPSHHSSNGSNSLQQQQQQQQSQPLDEQQTALPVVPWGLNTTITVLAVWLLGFWAAAYVAVPAVLELLSINPASTVPRIQAFKHLLLDIMQLGVTLLVLKRALQEYKPRQLGLFSISWQPWRKVLAAVASGALLFPLVDWVHKHMVALLTRAPATGGVGMDGMITAPDWVAHAMWYFVLTVCAPVWEEAMFRGFLLPSLARYMPIWVAVGASSLVFASVHFTREGFVPLLLLGAVFGASYVKTLNLLPAILLHSFWNVCLLAQILVTG